MTKDQFATDYRNACKEEMKKDLIEEFKNVMNSDTIFDKKKDWVFKMVMDTLKFAQEV